MSHRKRRSTQKKTSLPEGWYDPRELMDGDIVQVKSLLKGDIALSSMPVVGIRANYEYVVELYLPGGNFVIREWDEFLWRFPTPEELLSCEFSEDFYTR